MGLGRTAEHSFYRRYREKCGGRRFPGHSGHAVCFRREIKRGIEQNTSFVKRSLTASLWQILLFEWLRNQGEIQSGWVYCRKKNTSVVERHMKSLGIRGEK